MGPPALWLFRILLGAFAIAIGIGFFFLWLFSWIFGTKEDD